VTLAEGFEITWSTINGGAGSSSGAGFTLAGTIGQPDADRQSRGGDFALVSGFWTGFVTDPFPPGDLNCDNVRDGFDIDPFVLALTNPTGYEIEYPNCQRERADLNGDGLIDGFDIDPFVALLIGG
jgi:hypothetical protein